MRRRALWPALAGLCTWWLSGCATPTTDRHTPTWSGRFALRVLAEPPQAVSAGFELEGDPEAGVLRVVSPIGQTLATARWSSAGATLERQGSEQRYATLDALTEALTGTPLPIAALFAWLQGQAAHAEGWTVDLSAHHQNRLLAQRHNPLPTATLRVVFETPTP